MRFAFGFLVGATLMYVTVAMLIGRINIFELMP
jgi:hypothetical protein